MTKEDWYNTKDWLVYDYLLYGKKHNIKEEIERLVNNIIIMKKYVKDMPEEIFENLTPDGEISSREDLYDKLYKGLIEGLEDKIRDGIEEGLEEIFEIDERYYGKSLDTEIKFDIED